MNKIYNENNIETMKRFNDNSIDGIVTSPPYNITTKRKDNYYDNGYSDIDNLTEEDYIKKRINEFKEFERILTPKGVICYNISYHNNNPILPLLLMSEVHKSTGLTVADMITWKKKTSMPFQSSKTKLSRICEQVYIIVNKKHLHDFETNKTISKINEKTNQKFYKHYVNYIEAANNDGIKSKLKAAYSEELVLKLINIYFKPNTTIYDPFSGIGTTSRACKKSNINSFASELDKELYDLSIKLIK